MNRKNIVTAAILALAAVFIALGVMGGEPGGVLAKAARVCLECIGVG